MEKYANNIPPLIIEQKEPFSMYGRGFLCMKCGNEIYGALNCAICNQRTGECEKCGNMWECFCEIKISKDAKLYGSDKKW